MGTSLFQKHSDEQHTQSLADYLPNDRIFAAKNIDDTIFRNFLRGLAPEFARIEEYLIETSEQLDINCSTDLLENWERSVGIPDDCFNGQGDLSTRRLHVILKLAQMNVSTEQDFIDLAASLGFTITIESGIDNAFPPYDIPLLLAPNFPRFVWIVTGVTGVGNFPPYDIPLQLGNISNILTCVFNKLKPAMTRIIFTD